MHYSVLSESVGEMFGTSIANFISLETQRVESLHEIVNEGEITRGEEMAT